MVHPCEGARLAFWITLADGTVLPKGVPPCPVDAILRRWPVAGAVAKWAETEDEFIARIRAKDVPADATDVQIVDAAAIPADRTFRNAWKHDKGTVSVDMVKATGIYKDKLRELRAPKLAALDADYMKALESGDTAKMQTVATKKQALRDVTADPGLTAAKTPDELKAVIPGILL